eukprot:gene6241-4491_t
MCTLQCYFQRQKNAGQRGREGCREERRKPSGAKAHRKKHSGKDFGQGATSPII